MGSEQPRIFGRFHQDTADARTVQAEGEAKARPEDARIPQRRDGVVEQPARRRDER